MKTQRMRTRRRTSTPCLYQAPHWPKSQSLPWEHEWRTGETPWWTPGNGDRGDILRENNTRATVAPQNTSRAELHNTFQGFSHLHKHTELTQETKAISRSSSMELWTQGQSSSTLTFSWYTSSYCCTSSLIFNSCITCKRDKVYTSEQVYSIQKWSLRSDAQEIHLFAIRKMCPDVEYQSSLFSPQSESEYPINPALELPSYLIQSSFVPWRYLNTCFVYFICKSDGLLLYQDSCVAENAMAGLVPMAA